MQVGEVVHSEREKWGKPLDGVRILAACGMRVPLTSTPALPAPCSGKSTDRLLMNRWAGLSPVPETSTVMASTMSS